MSSNLWKQSREVVSILVVGGLFSAIFYFGILRIQAKNDETKESIQQAIVDRKMLEEQSVGISNMHDSWAHIQDANEKLHVFLPKDHIVSLVESLESIGRDLNVSVVSEASPAPLLAAPPAKKKSIESVASTKEGSDEVAPASVSVKDVPKEALVSLLPEERSIFITFKVTGAYEQVLAFLHKLDTMPTLLDVLSVEISPVLDEDGLLSGSSSHARVSPSPFMPNSTTLLSSPDVSHETVPAKPTEVLASFSAVIYTAP